jgi:transcriptional regulator with XRE-family HTH domain
LRVENGLTLEEVAAQAGLTRGWLSKVENFRVTPSLPALSSICQALGVTLLELVDGLDERPPLIVVRKNERVQVRRDEGISQLAYESLASKRPARRMDPFIIKVPPTDQQPALTHGGEEFLFVVKGTITLDYGERSCRLAPGDCAYIDGATPHRLVCVGKIAAEVLVVYQGMIDNGGEPNAEDH